MRRPHGEFIPAEGARHVPAGWELGTLNGKRVAKNPAGEITTYYQYLSAQARNSGFKDHNEYAKWRKRPDVREHLKADAKKTSDKQPFALGSELLRRYREAFFDRNLRGIPGKQLSIAPGSNLALYLEELGVRPKGATYPVGDTPRA